MIHKSIFQLRNEIINVWQKHSYSIFDNIPQKILNFEDLLDWFVVIPFLEIDIPIT